MPRKSVGQVVRVRRLALGLSQSELGRRAVLDGTYVSRIERGEIYLPEPETLDALARGLDWSSAEDIYRAMNWTEELEGEPGMPIPISGWIPAPLERWNDLTGLEYRDVRVLTEDIDGARSPFGLLVTEAAFGMLPGDVVFLDRPNGQIPTDGQIVAVLGEQGYALVRWPVDTPVEVIGLYLTFRPLAPR